MSGDRPGTDDGRSVPDATAGGVRVASADDLPRLLAIQGVAFPDPHRTLLRSGVRAELALVTVDVPVGPDGTGVAGYVLFTGDGTSVYIAELAVAPGHRRRGHGRRLLAAVAARHPGHERLRLTTRIDNEDARAFYASLGFREVGELPGYYGEAAAGGRADWSDTDAGSSADPDGGGDATDGVLLVRTIE